MFCQKWILKTRFFVKNDQNFVYFEPKNWFTFRQHESKGISNNVWRGFRLPVSSFAMVARGCFNGKFTAKSGYSIGHLILPYLTPTLEVLSLSIHYLISIWTMVENLNKIAWQKIYKSLGFLPKIVTIFEKELTPFWKTFCDINNDLMLKY